MQVVVLPSSGHDADSIVLVVLVHEIMVVVLEDLLKLVSVILEVFVQQEGQVVLLLLHVFIYLLLELGHVLLVEELFRLLDQPRQHLLLFDLVLQRSDLDDVLKLDVLMHVSNGVLEHDHAFQLRDIVQLIVFGPEDLLSVELLVVGCFLSVFLLNLNHFDGFGLVDNFLELGILFGH